jgi:phage shock protein E
MKTTLQRVLGALALGTALFFLMGATPTVTGEAAHALVKQGALLLDVRTTTEFESGHLEGAVNVPVQDLESKRSTLPAKKDQPIVVYCRSGHRSATAAELLKKAGYTKVQDLGAMSNWK